MAGVVVPFAWSGNVYLRFRYLPIFQVGFEDATDDDIENNQQIDSRKYVVESSGFLHTKRQYTW